MLSVLNSLTGILGTFLTLVEAPGRPDGVTALLLFGQTWQNFPTLEQSGHKRMFHENKLMTEC